MPLILCDELTTKLDTFQSESVMQTLTELAYAWNNFIFFIEKPVINILSPFYNLNLLEEGKQLYSSALQEAERYFNQAVFPPHDKEAFNPTERYLQFIYTEYSSEYTVL